MTEYVKAVKTLTSEERNLLSVAYKNVVGTDRSSYRTIANIIAKEGEKGYVIQYLKKVKDELCGVCMEVLVSVAMTIS